MLTVSFLCRVLQMMICLDSGAATIFESVCRARHSGFLLLALEAALLITLE